MAADNDMELKRHVLLTELADYTRALAIEHGIDAELADQFGVNVSNFIAEHFGGQTFSFPLDYHYKLAQRDVAIFNDYCRGVPKAALARRYNMTENGIWRVIDRTHKRIKRTVQPDLFS